MIDTGSKVNWIHKPRGDIFTWAVPAVVEDSRRNWVKIRFMRRVTGVLVPESRWVRGYMVQPRDSYLPGLDDA